MSDSNNSKKIEQLKTLNDWNKALNIDKCVKKKIENTYSSPYRTTKGEIEIDIMIDAFWYLNLDMNLYLSRYEYEIESYFQTIDEYERCIYFLLFRNNDTNQIERVFLLLFNSPFENYEYTDGIEIKDYHNFQDEMIKLKERNNWDKPIIN
jgi:hypothetical protein